MDGRLYSVLVPVYNTEKYVSACLNSVQNQTYKNFEVIIINDGSTDGSHKICWEYVNKDYRFKLYSQPNKGSKAARGNAISNASGDFYLFLDSDDYWDEDLLETVDKALDKGCYDMVIFGFKRIISDKCVKINAEFEDEIVFDKNNINDYVSKWITSPALNSVGRKVVSKDLIAKIDYSSLDDVSSGTDLVLSIPLIKYANRIIYLNKHLYNYRYNPNSITTTVKLQKFDNFLSLKTIFFEFLNSAGLYTYGNSKNFYINIIADFIDLNFQLIRSSKYNKAKKYEIIKKTVNYELFINALKIISVNDLAIRYKISFLFIKLKKIELFYIIECLISRVVIFRKILLGKKI